MFNFYMSGWHAGRDTWKPIDLEKHCKCVKAKATLVIFSSHIEIVYELLSLCSLALHCFQMHHV